MSNYLKITSKLEIPQPLNMDDVVEFTINGVKYTLSVVKIEIGSKQDGTEDITYKLKLFYHD